MYVLSIYLETYRRSVVLESSLPLRMRSIRASSEDAGWVGTVGSLITDVPVRSAAEPRILSGVLRCENVEKPRSILLSDRGTDE